jgi:CBS domain-containing protein
MTKEPITISSDATVKEALTVMIGKDVGSLIITEARNPVGIITERDVTRRSLSAEKTATVYQDPVAGLMSHPLITASPITPIWEAFETMVTKKIRRLPITEEGHLLGIVTERDLLMWVLRISYEPNIPDRIQKLIDSTYVTTS